MEEIFFYVLDFLFKWSFLIFSAVILILFFLALKDFRKSIKENPFGDYEQPRFFATLGVLGTFLGIFFGLLNFNPAPDAMQQSVVNLLSGMKTAFVTSIIGMVLSIILKYLQAKEQKNFPKNKINAAATIADLISYLKKSDAEKAAATQNLLNAVEKITASVAGDGDYTVIGQMKTIRLELRDHHEKIISELREFSKTLAENNTKAFIEALNTAIQDFNTKLTEQFGENFKQLNIAVGRLLEWQENYKSTLETVTENLETTFEGIDAAKNSLAQIENSAAAIQDLIVTANFYEQKLEKVLAEVATLGNSAENSVPQIINLVETSCNEIKKTSATAAENFNILSANVAQTVKRTDEMTVTIANLGNAAFNRLEKISAQTIQSMQEVSKRIETTSYKQRELMDAEIQATKDAVQKAAAILGEDAFKITNKISDALYNMMKINNDKLQKATEDFNKNLENVLKEYLEEIGDTMLKVSAKFATDYTPLTEKLAALIRISADAERRAYNEKT